MTEEMKKTKAQLNHEWITAADTGNAYLCPTGSVADKGNASEKELLAVCVDASGNPQNQIWQIMDTEHSQGYLTDPEVYIEKVTGFLERVM